MPNKTLAAALCGGLVITATSGYALLRHQSMVELCSLHYPKLLSLQRQSRKALNRYQTQEAQTPELADAVNQLRQASRTSTATSIGDSCVKQGYLAKP